MRTRIAVFLAIICLVTAEIKQNDQIYEKGRMVGVDTVHKINIDKDTLISSKELRKKNPEKKDKYDKYDNFDEPENEGTQTEEAEPDWSYSSFPEEVKGHVEKFKRNMTECLKEVQTSDKRPVKRLSPKVESPVYGECLIACVLKRNEVIHNGKIHKENLLNLVGKFYAKETRLMKKLENKIDRCVYTSSRIRNNDCALAAELNSCTNSIMENNKHKIVVNYK